MSTGEYAYGNLVDNPLWNKFTLYELTGKMRQRDQLEFTNILNLIGEHGTESLSDDQLNLINGRFVNDQSEIPSDAIVLFFKNEDVYNYNKERIAKLEGELIENKAADVAVGKFSSNTRAQNFAKQCQKIKDLDETGGLQYRIYLKNECRYIITLNQDVSDGIVNGAVGVLKKIVLHKNPSSEKPLVKRVWLLFENIDVGKKTRINNIDLCVCDDVDAKFNWTPINCIRQRIKTNNMGGGYSIDRIQLPIVEAESFTIHKSQGKTYQKCAVYISAALTKSLLYVALSRVTSLEGLFLFGARKTILSEKKSKLSLNERKKLVEKNLKTCVINSEMKRMRNNCQMINYFPFIRSSVDSQMNSFKLMFHNVGGSFVKNKIYIQNDRGFMNADVILLINTNTTDLDNASQLALKGFDLTNNIVNNEINDISGQMCFINNNLKKKLHFVVDNRKGKEAKYTKTQLEMSLYKYDFTCSVTKSFYICILYKHIGMDNTQFYDQFKKFLLTHLSSSHDSTILNRRLIILGTFNMDFNNMPKSLQTILTDLHLKPKMLQTPTHKCGSQYDWCFTNFDDLFVKNFQITTYESFFSNYSPLWLNLTD